MPEMKCRGQTSFWSKIANWKLQIANCKLRTPFKKPRRAPTGTIEHRRSAMRSMVALVGVVGCSAAPKRIAAPIKRIKNPKSSWASGKPLAYLALVLVCFSFLASAGAQETSNQPLTMKLPEGLSGGPKQWTSPEGLSSTIQVMLLLTVLSLAPALLLMTTCFVRIVVVLSLLRQAIGTQQLPPSQVITTLSLFLTFLIMAPVWKQVYNESIVPYTEHRISLEEAWKSGVAPVRRFMSQQIERTKNSEDIYLFMNYVPDQPARKVTTTSRLWCFCRPSCSAN